MGSASAVQTTWQVQLIGRWLLHHGDDQVLLPRRAQRLVTYLSLHPGCPRSVVASGLWPDSSEAHTRSNLRTTAIRLRRDAPGLLTACLDPLSLSHDVQVDLWGVREAIERAPREPDPAAAAYRLARIGSLLPGWYEDWVLAERDHLTQLIVLNLERLAEQLLNAGDLPAALQAVSRCIHWDPLRESSHRLLVRVHLASGNRIAAWQAYEQFRQCSLREFGLAPADDFENLVAPLRQERWERWHRRPKRAPGTAAARVPGR